MDFLTFMIKIFLSLALGGLLGIDREKTKKGYPAGIRTLAFIALLGFLSSFISVELDNYYFLIAVTLLIFVLVIVGYGVSFKTEKSFGFTSTIIIFLAFFIGIMSYYEEYYYFAVSLTIIVALLLTQKTFIHTLVLNIKDNELLDALKFGIIAFIILPLMPNKTIDPFNIINPFNLWLLVVLILSISYLGYIISKFLGKSNGIYISGLLGGIVSSTAVASSLSHLSKKSESYANDCAIGITLSSSVMFVRVFIESLIINFDFAKTLIIPLFSCLLIGLLISFLSIKKSKKESVAPEIIEESPFNLIHAFKFTALILAILFISKILLLIFGEAGIYLASFFGSLANTDAITVSIATLAKDSITYNIAWIAFIIAILTNNLVKLFLINNSGSKKVFNKILRNYALMNAPIIIWAIALLFQNA